MGFSDLGRSILRNNDRLRRNLKESYFRYSKNKTGNRKLENEEEGKKYLPKLDLKEDKGYRYLNWANFVTLILVILFTVLAYLTFDLYFGKAHAEYLSNLESISKQATEQAIKRENIGAYKQLIYNGHKYLEANQYDKAQWEFSEALKIYKSGKTANYGMTMTLLNQCLQKNQYCEQANAYLERLKASEKFTNEELDNLEQIK